MILLEAQLPSKKKRQPRILGPAGKRSLEAKLPSKNKPQKVPTPSKMKHQVLKLPALVLKVH